MRPPSDVTPRCSRGGREAAEQPPLERAQVEVERGRGQGPAPRRGCRRPRRAGCGRSRRRPRRAARAWRGSGLPAAVEEHPGRVARPARRPSPPRSRRRRRAARRARRPSRGGGARAGRAGGSSGGAAGRRGRRAPTARPVAVSPPTTATRRETAAPATSVRASPAGVSTRHAGPESEHPARTAIERSTARRWRTRPPAYYPVVGRPARRWRWDCFRNRGISDDERDRIPPGQHLVRDFPVLHAWVDPLPERPARLGLPGDGASSTRPLRWTMDELRAQPVTSVTCDIHCVTSWSKLDTRWEGVALAPLLRELGIHERRHARGRPRRGGLHGQHAPRGAARRRRAARLPLRRPRARARSTAGRCGCCCRASTSGRAPKWLRGLELLDHDQPGFWERLGYNNDADPWKEERYAF